MSDSLRQVLTAVDGSAPSIQKAASAMMKHYDHTTAVAVTAWRDVLSTARTDLLLPLLYVCNEVLQISKRNRGAKFLEAFSGVLGPCLIHICQRDTKLTEKVRRTVKIWGDRRVFSVRFVQDLLNGLEPYRGGGASSSGGSRNLPKPPPPFVDDSEEKNARSSSTPEPEKPDVKKDDDDNDDDSIQQLLENENVDDDMEPESDEDIFASGGESKLSIDIDLDKVGTEQPGQSTPRSGKRRRSSMGSTGSETKRKKKKRTVFTISNLVDTLTRLSSLQQNFEYSQLGLQRIDAAIEKTPEQELEQLVGDELQLSFRQTQDFLKQIQDQRKELYENAQERHNIEKETVGYVNWLEKALNLDDDDIMFCDKLEEDIVAFQPIHADIRKARDLRRAEEERKRAEEAEKERKRREAEETEKFRRATLQKKTEGGKGLVWNPNTREYQELNTDESWRDF
uniref:CID domain-containing protein n=1 Tax=Amphora coffeiformis TaxID=265554 RepID=A0A7S3L364_9STRA|mmetsp:Transcript_11113/g.21274  ORF Transcript_11113/g.21274 Transcript_11113/m.21274 type:complete len:453 (-) Transcript_11113:15-1373(-)|eukprot:scaffold34698_cov173-Amphora_coffeaeformis.AAC.4